MNSAHPKFHVARDEFANAVAWVARALPSGSREPIMQNILLDVAVADGEKPAGITITAFNGDTSAQMHIAADVDEAGTTLVSGRLLTEIAKALPAKPVSVETSEAKMSIVCGSAKFSLPTAPVEGYPQVPDLPEVSGSVEADIFAEAVAQVAIAAGKDDTLPMLTGIRMEITGETLTLIATDRFRLALRELPWQAAHPDASGDVLIPAKTLADVARSFGHGSAVSLHLGAGNQLGDTRILGIRADEHRTTARLLDAEFPQVRRLLPTEHSAMAMVEVAPLLAAIKRVSLVAERGVQIRMDFSAGQVDLAAGGDDAAAASESLPVDFVGEPLVIAFNPAYLLDGLNSVSTPKAVLAFTRSNSPAVLRPAPEELPEAQANGSFAPLEANHTYLLMPVRLPG